MKIVENAYAKVNLHLDVLKKRKDGYHDIGTIFQTIGIHDVLEFQSREDDQIILLGADGLTARLEDNLVYKAALSLRQFALAHSLGVTITITKSLPAGAGLGGGSADAAATLRGLRKLWSLKVSDSELESLGAELGADVPFMIHGGTQVARGIGELLEEIPETFFENSAENINASESLSSNWLYNKAILIVTPSDFVSTATAYAELEPRGDSSFETFMSEINDSERLPPSERLFFNHFEKTVFPKHPQIQSLRDWMLQEGAEFSVMSGSGASVFGVYKTPKEAQKAFDLVESKFEGIRFKKVTFFEKKILNP